MSNRRKRRTFAEQSVMAYMLPGETYAQAKARLDAAWARGEHPAQQKGD